MHPALIYIEVLFNKGIEASGGSAWAICLQAPGPGFQSLVGKIPGEEMVTHSVFTFLGNPKDRGEQSINTKAFQPFLMNTPRKIAGSHTLHHSFLHLPTQYRV